MIQEEKRSNIIIGTRAESKIEVKVQVLSNAAIRDELVYQLGSAATYEITDDKTVRINRKYYDLAGYVPYRINIWPTMRPLFVINTSDLSQSLRDELEQLQSCNPNQFDKTVTEAIDSLMEGVNKRYYHVSGVANKIKWRFDS